MISEISFIIVICLRYVFGGQVAMDDIGSQYALVCMSLCMLEEVGGGYRVPCSITLCSIPWRQGLSLNVKLTEHCSPPVSTLQSAAVAGLLSKHCDPDSCVGVCTGSTLYTKPHLQPSRFLKG